MSEIKGQPYREEDDIVPLLHPFTGRLDFDTLCGLIRLLCLNFQQVKTSRLNSTFLQNLKYLKRKMCHTTKTAVIGKRSTNTTFVDRKKRDCQRLTFGPEMVEQVKSLIFNKIKAVANNQYIEIDDIIIEPSHGDILYYPKGGKFNPHRDGLLEFDKSYTMYTLVIGLDSRLEEGTYDGNTIVYLPSVASNYMGMNSIYNKKTDPHVFDQSCRRGEFVIFPAGALHESCNITKGNKMALKLDLFIKIPELSGKSLDNIQGLTCDGYHTICKCRLCYPERHLVPVFSECLDMPTVLIDIIIEYYCSFREMCSCSNNCSCTCYRCLENYGCTPDEDHYEDRYHQSDYDDYDDYCNGYDDEWY
jgi:hypothetical protein